ncbi:uncharacterized protein (DUF58 family) [Microbacterium terrae]|uniref:DUF58 domain-containing protein n=1 Tax=Microbacterium terrae TaxID=69369 RepID=A0A0M2H5I7_9MICO|nr:DUF58 domain-containing protein [Microbacterium terrae]KJL41755.1 hypothetical protein RS81_01340 [Microbacterium terrae]MBP1077954.1 uncharacterized protein (DUF58 family) [Microbacterium terrae]GLK00126.1 lipoprotein [Microbacterium terrae]
MHLTARAALLVAVGAVPVVLLAAAGVDAWAAAAGWIVLCLVLVLADAIAAPDPRRIEVSRDVPRRALLGQQVVAEVRLRNTGSRTVRGRVRDAWQPTAGAPADRIRIIVPPGESRSIRVPLLPRRRGELTSRFVVVRSDGLLRLAGRQARLESLGALPVLPPFTARRHLPSRLARLRELDGSTSVQVRGQGTEFDSLREYVRGDDVRSIDWRATARSSTTMLRTWRPERDRHVVIVIDTGRTAAARVGDGVRMDAAIEAALLLAALAQRAGDHVHLVMFDRAVRARVSRVDGPGLLPALVDAMAPVEPQLIDTDWDAAFAQVRSLTSRPSLVVLLTAQDSPDAARGFLGSLGALTARTRVLVGTVTDEPVTSPERPDAADVYRLAAVERATRDARVTAAAMARAGAESLTGSPDDLPPRIADRYLALKAAGRL